MKDCVAPSFIAWTEDYLKASNPALVPNSAYNFEKGV
jgi:hypothetical protein